MVRPIGRWACNVRRVAQRPQTRPPFATPRPAWLLVVRLPSLLPARPLCLLGQPAIANSRRARSKGQGVAVLHVRLHGCLSNPVPSCRSS